VWFSTVHGLAAQLSRLQTDGAWNIHICFVGYFSARVVIRNGLLFSQNRTAELGLGWWGNDASIIFVESRDSGTCSNELDFRCKTSLQDRLTLTPGFKLVGPLNKPACRRLGPYEIEAPIGAVRFDRRIALYKERPTC
jgi:hypothetical protein